MGSTQKALAYQRVILDLVGRSDAFPAQVAAVHIWLNAIAVVAVVAVAAVAVVAVVEAEPRPVAAEMRAFAHRVIVTMTRRGVS